jgi:23S rRNA (pseudouridine1915-N3)-methyltransferase
MKSAHLIVVGKLKDKNLYSLEAEYLKRIKNPQLLIHEVKAIAEDQEEEAKSILKKAQSLGADHFLIILTEFGQEFHSPMFSKWIYEKVEAGRELIFVICGAQGPTKYLLEKSNAQLSLSKLTYPHKLARLIFIEQFYRAMTINTGHPYHN